mmetsp:Transcript_2476/g.3564  ORF Transcript_2476/g.3564 Transcript_2476/m.3564 type:complete len:343 (-) Transcript_2476:143-1171(-)
MKITALLNVIIAAAISRECSCFTATYSTPTAILRRTSQSPGLRWNSRRHNSATSLYMSDTARTAEIITKEETESPSIEDVQTQQQVGFFSNISAKDINGFINTAVVVAVLTALVFKVTSVDAGLTRGWTPEEIATRIPIDNWIGYSSTLHNSPISTKAITSASVYTIGDVIAQKTEGAGMGELDRPRIIRSLLAGLIGHGPMSHFWYEYSEDFFDNVLHLTEWWSFFPKVAIDQATWGPLWNNTYILLLGLMKLDSWERIWGDMKRTTIPLIVSGLKLWPLAHCVTYGLIPVENRLLWVDLVEIIWVTILANQASGDGHGAVHGEPDKTTAENDELAAPTST